MRAISILGSTGSIGTQTLDVVQSLGNGHRIVALSARSKWKELAGQIRDTGAGRAALHDTAAAASLRKNLNGTPCEVLDGDAGLMAVATHPEAEVVVSSIVGAAGLKATLAAVKAGKRVAIANKESLVVAGSVLVREAEKSGAEILPIDSEHSAIFQSLQSGRAGEVERLILTASGGPFRKRAAETFDAITVEEALKHPNWTMGPKITVDSATLMNKALEIIEAKYLFGVEPGQIRVLIHPQSIVHSGVEFRDGSVVVQMGLPDMRLPIQYALTYPDRLRGSAPRLDLAKAGTLDFEEPDLSRFPALRLGYEAALAGGTMEPVLSAANEVAVEAFLAGRLPFVGIPALVERVMRAHARIPEPTLEEALEADRWARATARGFLEKKEGAAR